jgi:hypothetical protein
VSVLDPQDLVRLRRSSLYAAAGTAVGAVMVIGALAYGMWELHSIGEQVKEKQGQLTEAERQRAQAEQQRLESEKKLDALRAQLGQKQEDLKKATDLWRHIHPISYSDLKDLAVNNARAFPLLEHSMTLAHQKVKYKVGGKSPQEGFDSVTFAAYVLRTTLPKEKLGGDGADAWTKFEEVSNPRVGDLAFYVPSYAMFYFVDLNKRPFVIGMTPFGIVSLNPDFAELQGYRRVPHPGE